MMDSGEWAHPVKLRENYPDYLVSAKDDPEYQIYRAVLDGAIRVRHNGRILTKQEAGALGEKRWSDAEGDYYALPPDIELSVEDAKRVLENFQPARSRLMVEIGERFIFGSYSISEDTITVTFRRLTKSRKLDGWTPKILAAEMLRELAREAKG
jgi:hypothetical protein